MCAVIDRSNFEGDNIDFDEYSFTYSKFSLYKFRGFLDKISTYTTFFGKK